MNRFERPSPSAVEAEVEYLDGDIRVRRPGAFLRYWNVDLQEAYASPEAKLKRLGRQPR